MLDVFSRKPEPSSAAWKKRTLSLQSDEEYFCCSCSDKKKKKEKKKRLRSWKDEQIYRAWSHGWVNLNKKSCNGLSSVSAFCGQAWLQGWNRAMMNGRLFIFRDGIASGSGGEEEPLNIFLPDGFIYQVAWVTQDTVVPSKRAASSHELLMSLRGFVPAKRSTSWFH